MSVKLFLLGSALLLAGVACERTDPLSPGQLRALELAEQRWASARIIDYEFEVREVCECPIVRTQWTLVEVRGSRVSRATPLSGRVTQAEVDALRWPTVDSLFVRIRAAVRSEWALDASFRFDSTYGYPITAAVNSKTGVQDAGLALFVRAFSPR